MLSCTQRRVIKIKNSPIIIRHDSTTQGHVCVRFSVFLFFLVLFLGVPTRDDRQRRRVVQQQQRQQHIHADTHIFIKSKKQTNVATHRHAETHRNTHTHMLKPTHTDAE